MYDKDLDDAYNSFWNANKPSKKKFKKIRSINSKRVSNPSVKRINKYYDTRRPLVRSLPTQRQTISTQDYYSQKARSINSQANYLLAQKRLYEARIKAREVGYRTPAEKMVAMGQRTGTGGIRALKGLGERVQSAQRNVGLKGKVRSFFKKSIYD